MATNVSSFVEDLYLIVWLLSEPQFFVCISADLMGSKAKVLLMVALDRIWMMYSLVNRKARADMCVAFGPLA